MPAARDDRTLSSSTSSAPTLATISADDYWWGYNFVFPEASMSALEESGDVVETFLSLLGDIAEELKPILDFVEDYLKADLGAAKLVDEGAGVYLSAAWIAPAVLVPTPIKWQFIASGLGHDLVLDVKGASPDPETPIDVWTQKLYSEATNQLWTYVNDLYLVGDQSGLVLEIADSDPSDGATIQINNWTGAPNQQWLICGDGFVRSLMNGNVLDVSGASPNAGTPVISYHAKYPQCPNQDWVSDLAPSQSCNGLVTTVTNNTPTELTIVATPSSGTELSFPQQPSQPLSAGGVATFVSAYDSENEVSFGIYAPGSTKSVASFDVHQHYCFMEAGDVWADNFNWIGNYILDSQPSDWFVGSYHYDKPGMILCAVNPT